MKSTLVKLNAMTVLYPQSSLEYKAAFDLLEIIEMIYSIDDKKKSKFPKKRLDEIWQSLIDYIVRHDYD